MSNLVMPRRSFLSAAGAGILGTVLPRSLHAESVVKLPAAPITDAIQYIPDMMGQGDASIALVVSNDFSGSIKNNEKGVDEITLQIEGTARAFETDYVIQAIESRPGGVLCTQTQFTETTCQSVGWARLQSKEDCLRFAGMIRAAGVDRRVSGKFNTHIAQGLAFNKACLDGAPFQSAERIVDVSGDGPENSQGMDTVRSSQLVRAQVGLMESHGIKINGLPICNEDPLLDQWYKQNVITSDGFVMPARGFVDYADMLISKLMLEIAGIERGKSPAFAMRGLG